MKAKQDRFIFKASLLSISLFLMMAPQIASALPLMYHAFKGVQAVGHYLHVHRTQANVAGDSRD